MVRINSISIGFAFLHYSLFILEEEEEEEGLEDDDLELLEENTGASFTKGRLTRLRRGHDSDSPPATSSSKRRPALESSDDDLDNDDLEIPQVQDIQRIWDDDRAGDREDDEDLDDMDNFIEYDDPEDGAGNMDEEEREEKRKERKRVEKERRKAMGAKPDLAGIDAK